MFLSSRKEKEIRRLDLDAKNGMENFLRKERGRTASKPLEGQWEVKGKGIESKEDE